MDDYFAVFGLPRKLTVDGEALRQRFYELSRAHHPDFHQAADDAAQAETLARSALVNRAYRALRDPVARVESENATYAGLGLGLFIVRKVVDAHGGNVSVEASAQDGTTFTMVLPRRA